MEEINKNTYKQNGRGPKSEPYI